MDKKDSEFQKRIQATFRIEAQEHLLAISSGLNELEKTQSPEKIAAIIEVLFREVHSLKGGARSVDQKEIESVCQPLECIFSGLKRQEISLSPHYMDLFYKSVDLLTQYVSGSVTENPSVSRLIHRDLIMQLKEVVSGKNPPASPPDLPAPEETISEPGLPSADKRGATSIEAPGKTVRSHTGMVRIPRSKLDPLLLQAEELIQSKSAIDHRIDEIRLLHDELSEWRSEFQKFKNRRSEATTSVWNEWYDSCETKLNRTEGGLAEIISSMERDHHSLDRMVNDHLDEMKQILMLPVSALVEVFPGMVREIAREQKKEVDFIIRGAELEIDKRILDELKDPLIHLIRNSIDHGIGTPRERTLVNKTARGTIKLAFAARENGQVEITLSDDGRGISPENVLRAAVKAGVISGEEAESMDRKEAVSLIFNSGVSTSSIITDISGRGLGLPIVKEKIEQLAGKLTLETESGTGTTFRLLLPMSLATFRGILVSAGGMQFILPAMNVETVLRVSAETVKTVGNHETILVGGIVLPLVSLAESLGLPERPGIRQHEKDEQEHLKIVVLAWGESRMAFRMDDVLDEQQVLVKGLGKLLTRVRNVSGATVLGSGKVVPVLNVSDLLKSAVSSTRMIRELTDETVPDTRKANILVAEDSITSRTLIKNILETAGYMVTTAVDGSDAYTIARAGDFDLVVSDVDMPKMNGFELTAKIKSDKKLGETPVVLVTALESREDREHGIEVGADAYIIKSSFDQSTLLEVIKKLI